MPQAVSGENRRLSGLVLAALLAMAAYRWTRNIVDPDLWHEMSLAREIFQEGSVPWRDSFAFTETVYPVVHHEWGAGVIAYMMHYWFELPGLSVLRYCLMLLLAFLSWRIAWRLSLANVICFYLAIPAIILADRGFSPIRAQLYSFVFVSLLLGYLRIRECHQGVRGWLWILPHVLWLNLHAGFLVGAGLYLVDFCERFLRGMAYRRSLCLGLIMIAAIGLNPYGWHYFGYLASAVPLARPLVHEWDPIWRTDFNHQFVFWMTILLSIYAFSYKTNRQFLGWPLILVTAFEAARHERMLPFFAIAWFIHMPLFLSNTPLGVFLQKTWQRRRVFIQMLAGGMLIFFGSLWLRNDPFTLQVPAVPPAGSSTGLCYPVEMVDYFSQLPTSEPIRMVVPFDVGGYVSWHLYPKVLVSIDGRYEVAYPPRAALENWNLYLGIDTAMPQIRSDHVDAVLVPNSLPLKEKMDGEVGFVAVVSGASFSLYRRVKLQATGAGRK